MGSSHQQARADGPRVGWGACGQWGHDSDPELQAPGKLAKTPSLQGGVSAHPTERGPDPKLWLLPPGGTDGRSSDWPWSPRQGR